MVKILEEGKPITCSCCKSKLQYQGDDVKVKLISRGPCDYGGDYAGTEEVWNRYIICPNCKAEVSIDFSTVYR